MSDVTGVLEKRQAYRSHLFLMSKAKMREYWMIDPDKRKLIIYEFEDESYPAVYGPEGKIHVGIFGKKILIDMHLAGDMIQDYPDGEDSLGSIHEREGGQ